MYKVCLLTLCFLFVLSDPGMCLEGDTGKLPERDSDFGLYGLVMHQAKSPLGNEFFQYFSSYWQAPQGIEGYNIFISDKVHPRFGTWIFIAVNDATVFRERLNNRLWEIDNAAKKAITQVDRYIHDNYGDQKMRLDEEDIAGDGL